MTKEDKFQALTRPRKGGRLWEGPACFRAVRLRSGGGLLASFGSGGPSQGAGPLPGGEITCLLLPDCLQLRMVPTPGGTFGWLTGLPLSPSLWWPWLAGAAVCTLWAGRLLPGQLHLLFTQARKTLEGGRQGPSFSRGEREAPQSPPQSAVRPGQMQAQSGPGWE